MNRLGNRLWLLVQKLVLLRNQPLMLRLLIYSALLVLVPLSLVGVISYRESSYIMEREARESSWQIIGQVRTNMEYYITGFEIDSIKLLNRTEVKEMLQKSSAAEIEASGLQASVKKMLQEIAYSRSDISRISVFLDNETVITTDRTPFSESTQDLKKEYWYDFVPHNADIKLISRVIQIRDRSEPVISMVKRLIHPLTLEPVGMMIVDINFKRIQEISDQVTVGRTGYMSIVDAEGYYLYRPGLSGFGQRSGLALVRQMAGQKYGSFRLDSDTSEYLTFGYSPYLKWYIVTSYPEKELLEGVYNIRSTIAGTVIITLCVAYLLGSGFAASLVRPIRRLQRFVSQVKQGDLKVRAAVKTRDEIGRLTLDFNRMVERLEGLVEEVYLSQLKEKDLLLRQSQIELKMLQSQMNPHFLFNSLETIRGMALEKGMNDISRLSSALSRLLRYNLNNHSPFVTLKEELEVCDMYLSIQKFRFEERLQYRFDIPEWAFEQKVVKFSLQPLVENSVVHGMESRDGTVHVVISAERAPEPGRFLVRIRDNGNGISTDRLVAIRRDLEKKDILSGGRHIGIVNVHRRLVQLIGDFSGIHLESQPGQGTDVWFYLSLDDTG
ncbi:sensor histidine kinase [Cohnella pontilimi]|uniref:Sensor histidine kinase n=1 Tax=Cohnella pontilimi TaxID=2564100 RepID=A0A4U0FAX7_9BACL|nr:sensor histidine kinase [Cohnella pontilimi]TJY41314.1 sensor histidine kinase [Cohnella pontilimi]